MLLKPKTLEKLREVNTMQMSDTYKKNMAITIIFTHENKEKLSQAVELYENYAGAF